MGATTLNLESLGQIDSGLAKNIAQAEIDRAVKDLDETGTDCKVRKVTIEIQMWRDKKSGKIEMCLGAQAKLPPKYTRDLPARTKKDKGRSRLLFSEMEDEEEEFDAPSAPDEDGGA